MYLKSERLKFEKFEVSELQNYVSVVTNDNVMKYLTGESISVEVANQKFVEIIEINAKYSGFGYFSIKKIHGNVFLGYAKLTKSENNKVEIGCCLLPEFWGKSYASEMFEFIIKHGSEMPNITELIAIVNIENRSSKAILSKSNFVHYDTKNVGDILKEYYRLTL